MDARVIGPCKHLLAKPYHDNFEVLLVACIFRGFRVVIDAAGLLTRTGRHDTSQKLFYISTDRPTLIVYTIRFFC